MWLVTTITKFLTSVMEVFRFILMIPLHLWINYGLIFYKCPFVCFCFKSKNKSNQNKTPLKKENLKNIRLSFLKSWHLLFNLNITFPLIDNPPIHPNLATCPNTWNIVVWCWISIAGAEIFGAIVRTLLITLLIYGSKIISRLF